MSLIIPPANILGVVVPHPGLAPTSVSSLLVNGTKGWMEDIGSALTSLSINFDIDGTSTIIAAVEDPQRTLLRSKLCLQRSYIAIDGVTFVMAEIDKAGPQITLTFEHAVCSKLKDHTESLSVRAEAMSRTSFVAKLVAYEHWIQLQMPGGPESQRSVEMLSTGSVDTSTGGVMPLNYSTTFQEKETFWDSTGSILSTIGWRRFPRGSNGLVVASDQWLFNQTPNAVLDEDSDGVDAIDFNYDIRKPLGKITITCRASAWAFPVGSVIQFTPKMGIVGAQDYGTGIVSSTNPQEETQSGQLPPVAGHWLVTNISRSLLGSSAIITLDLPNLTLTEPQTQPPTSPINQVATYLTTHPSIDLGSASAQTGKNALPQIAKFVSFAKAKVGGPYVWGGTGPTGYDCSGLVKAAAETIGVALPHNSVAIYNVCAAAKTTCSVATAIKTYGALLLTAPDTNGEPSAAQGGGHIAISLGDGTTVEATGSAEGICYNVASAARFNQGALIPGVTY